MALGRRALPPMPMKSAALALRIAAAVLAWRQAESARTRIGSGAPLAVAGGGGRWRAVAAILCAPCSPTIPAGRPNVFIACDATLPVHPSDTLHAC